MKNDNEIRKEWMDLQRKSFKEIEAVLRKYDYNAQTMLATFCASICDVDYADLFVDSKESHKVHSRWLYMYALRYMTHEPYDKIARRMTIDGCKFTLDGVRKSTEKMGDMIENDLTWRNRWVVIKRMIKLWQNPHDYPLSDNADQLPQKYKLTLHVPKEMKDGVEVEIKEKN